MLSNATLDLLKYSPHPSLAAALEARIEAVVARWQTLVREKLPTADLLTLEQVRDEIPAILHELALTLESTDGSHFATLERYSEGHGQLRYHQSYNVNEVMIEYGLLRPLLLDEVVAQLGRDLTPDEAAAINMGVDTALRRSVTRFTSYQQTQLKVVAEAQSKYLSFLSHDLRGGLNGVLLMIEVLKRELAGEDRFAESMDDLDMMRRSILDTVGTMDRFLHAERFRQGKVEPHNSTVDLRFVLRDLLSQFAHVAAEKGVTLQADVPAGITAVTDKDMLVLIVQNLLSNAIKYTPHGHVRVAASAVDGHMVRVAVTDQGPGIAPARLPLLFEPFTRGDTHGQGGVGLGLSIAKQAADLIGGKLSVESTPGTGSTFAVELRT